MHHITHGIMGGMPRKENASNMLKTRFLVAGLILLTLLLVVIAFFGAKRQTQQEIAQPTPTPVAPFIPNRTASPSGALIPTGATFDIDSVSVSNFYQTTTPFDQEGDRTLADVPDQFRITFLPGDKQFLIVITGNGFAQNRAAAEQQLLISLGITQEEACKLHVVIRTISSANPNEAGQDYTLSFCTPSSISSLQPTPILYQTHNSLNVAVGSPPDDQLSDLGAPLSTGSLDSLVNAVNQILTCEGGGAHAPYPYCVRNLNIPQQFKNNLNATYPNFACGQFIWSAQGVLGWPVFPGNVGSVFQWYTMNPGHRQNGYNFVCNPYQVNNCPTSKTSQSSGAIAPGDIILYGSTGRSDPGHIAIVIDAKSDLFTVRVAEANYRHGVTWFRWTNLRDDLGRGADILGWWRKK